MYRLDYTIGGIKAVAKHKDPKHLRLLIKQIEESKETVEWSLSNEGGIVLDSSKEQEEERKKKK